MKRFIYLGISTLIFGLSLYISAFRFLDNSSDPTSIDLVIRQYRTNLDEFAAMTGQLADRAKQLENNPESIQSLKDVFKNTRLAYKKIEFLAEYTSPEFVKDFFNGAPLPSIPRDTDAMEVKEPEGLQRMEELIYDEAPQEEKQKIITLANKLLENTREFIKIQRAIFLKDRFVFEAARWQMVRVLTLGVTGFDNPVEPNSLEEARTSLGSVHSSLQAYYPKLREKKVSLEKEIENLFVRADEYLKTNNDFDSFDRLEFLTDFLNPLFKNILAAQKAIGIPNMYIVNSAGTKFAHNYNAENIFDEDFINPYFYTELVKKQDSEELRKLGQSLFYDPILSSSKERSCASCHNPEKSFTDNEKKSIATGYEGTVDRNAPTLIHSVYATRYFYDLNTEKLEQQIQHVIFNPKEFNTKVLEIIELLKKSDEYSQMFDDAFPEVKKYNIDPMNVSTMGLAISSYVASIRGYSSKFDQYVRGEINEIDESVKSGFNIFMGKGGCGTCHFAPNFSGLVPPLFEENESEVLGVPSNKDPEKPVMDRDGGRGATGMLKERMYIYNHSFKTTTVRNVENTFPYMHNGVYDSLEEVVDFYNRGGGVGMGLDIPNQTLPPDPLNLSDQEQKDLVAFMKSLTDTKQFLGAPKQLPQFPENLKLNDRKIGGVY